MPEEKLKDYAAESPFSKAQLDALKKRVRESGYPVRDYSHPDEVLHAH